MRLRNTQNNEWEWICQTLMKYSEGYCLKKLQITFIVVSNAKELTINSFTPVSFQKPVSLDNLNIHVI